jgi:hypothetical protein
MSRVSSEERLVRPRGPAGLRLDGRAVHRGSALDLSSLHSPQPTSLSCQRTAVVVERRQQNNSRRTLGDEFAAKNDVGAGTLVVDSAGFPQVFHRLVGNFSRPDSSVSAAVSAAAHVRDSVAYLPNSKRLTMTIYATVSPMLSFPVEESSAALPQDGAGHDRACAREASATRRADGGTPRRVQAGRA